MVSQTPTLILTLTLLPTLTPPGSTLGTLIVAAFVLVRQIGVEARNRRMQNMVKDRSCLKDESGTLIECGISDPYQYHIFLSHR